MERGVVHDDHASWRKFGQKVLLHPGCEDFGVDVGPEQADGEQRSTQQSANCVYPALRPPIVCSKAALPLEGITVGAWRIMSKTALINENQWLPFFFMAIQGFLEGLPCVCARLWMLQAFFYK